MVFVKWGGRGERWGETVQYYWLYYFHEGAFKKHKIQAAMLNWTGDDAFYVVMLLGLDIAIIPP